MDNVETRNERLKEKEDNLADQLDEDRDGRPNDVIGLPENIRVVFSNEHIPNDG